MMDQSITKDIMDRKTLSFVKQGFPWLMILVSLFMIGGLIVQFKVFELSTTFLRVLELLFIVGLFISVGHRFFYSYAVTYTSRIVRISLERFRISHQFRFKDIKLATLEEDTLIITGKVIPEQKIDLSKVRAEDQHQLVDFLNEHRIIS